MKYRELLKEGMEELKKAGITDAQIDAEYLLEYVSGMNRASYLMCMMEQAPEDVTERYRKFIKMRATHEPLQYITGEQELLEEALAIEKRSQDRKKLGWGLTIGGAIGYAAGLGVMFSSLNDPDNFEKPLLTGTAISLLFAIPLSIGIEKILYVEKQDVSASFAAGIADIYNRELEAKIKVSF